MDYQNQTPGGSGGRNQRNNDFDQAMRALGDLLNGVADEVHHSLRGVMPEVRDSLRQAGDELRNAFAAEHAGSGSSKRYDHVGDAGARAQRKILQQRRKYMSGRRGWFHFCSVSGTIVTLGLLLTTGILGASFMSGYFYSFGVLVLMGFFTIFAGVVTSRFRKIYRRFRMMQRYLEIVGSRPCCTIMELAAGTAQSEKETVNQLMDLIRRGEFPTAYLDPDRTILFLDVDLFREYMSGGRAAPEAPEKEAAQPEETAQPQPEPQPAEEPSQADFLQTGFAYTRQLERYAREITDPATANEAQQIAEVSRRILNHVKENPEKQPQIRKFLDYYLPTTVKLLQSYIGYDQGGYTGSNVQNIRRNITGILKTIRGAFINLLDSLFQEEALDISTDITVLKSLLEQEGLSENGSGPFAVK